MQSFKELVKMAQKGDSNAFAELYSSIYKELYYFALTNLNSPDDAADAVQDAVLDAFVGLKNLRSEDAFKGWMLRILTAKIKRKQAEYIQDRDNLTYINGQDEDGDDREYEIPDRESKYEGIELLDQIECLSQNEKMCFSLNIIYGYTSDEISEITGINSATVRTYLARGKNKLRKLLDGT